MKSQVLPNGTTVHTSGVLPRLAEVQVKLAQLQKELAELIEVVSVAGFLFPIGVVETVEDFNPATTVENLNPAASMEAVMREWSKANSKPPDESIRNKVLQQIEEMNIRETPVPRPPSTEEAAANQEYLRQKAAAMADRVNKVAAVFQANGIDLGLRVEQGPPSDIPHFVIPNHRPTEECFELLARAFGTGQFTLEGSLEPTAPAADLRKRPDLFPPVPAGYGVPRMQPVVDHLNDLKAATRPVVVPSVLNSNIPPSFDGTTGTRSGTIKMVDKVPNADDKGG
jgi:hypothetical protein